MSEKTTQKDKTGQQPNAAPDDANVKAPDTGDRELSDADLDKVSGGASSEPLRVVRPTVRSL